MHWANTVGHALLGWSMGQSAIASTQTYPGWQSMFAQVVGGSGPDGGQTRGHVQVPVRSSQALV